ncbi:MULTISPECIES: BA14K family protein [unclassified Rhizobium]|uniref:BA14K family protein n=1 Tax=unclassified Rhizobium TaxID=2613769 RepID=UPI0013AEE9F1|nr:BA14K family protein [Rhizobium sp. AN80A]
MNGLASVAFGIVTVMGTVTLAASIASIGMAENTQQDLRGLMDANLWTTEPTRVYPALQTYIRLPPALSTYAMADTREVAKKPLAVAASAPTDTSPLSTGMSVAHLNWCSSRYRSFDPTTNTYRTFEGQVRVCQPPFESRDPASTSPVAALPANTARWCASRYRSYRADDNTYQPYSGPRVECTPPAEAQTVAAIE